MSPENIERISQLVGYVIFFTVWAIVGFLFGTKLGKSILRRNPNNPLLPLYFSRYVKTSWKAIYVAIGVTLFILLAFFANIDSILAILASFPSAVYAGHIIAKVSKTSVWEDGAPPKIEDIE